MNSHKPQKREIIKGELHFDIQYLCFSPPLEELLSKGLGNAMYSVFPEVLGSRGCCCPCCSLLRGETLCAKSPKPHGNTGLQLIPTK